MDADTTLPSGPTTAAWNPVVVVLGDTGSGKSSTLNALLGEVCICPTNGMRACTAAIIELAALPLSPQGRAAAFSRAADGAHQQGGGEAPAAPRYQGAVEFLASEDWEAELAGIYAALTDPATGALIRECPSEKDEAAHVAWWKLRSIFGKVVPREELEREPPRPPVSLEDVCTWLREQLPPDSCDTACARAREHDIDGEVLLSMSAQELGEVLKVNNAAACESLCRAMQSLVRGWAPAPAAAIRSLLAGGPVRFDASSSQELHAHVQPYVDSANDTSAGSLWPLVKRVRLQGPWIDKIGGAVLVDAPGVQDDNSARDKLVREYLAAADSILIVANIRRAVNDKTAKDSMPLGLRQMLVDHGRAGALAFVATASDCLEPSEIIHNLSLDPGSSRLQCALARNAFTRRTLTLGFYQGLALGGNAEAACELERAAREHAEASSRAAAAAADATADGAAAAPTAAVLSGSGRAAGGPIPKAKSVLADRRRYRGCEAWKALRQVAGGLRNVQPKNPRFKRAVEQLEVAAGMAWEHETGLEYEWEVAPALAAARPPAPVVATAAADAAGNQDQEGCDPCAPPASGRFAFRVFTVSSVDCQKLEGVRQADGAAHTFVHPDDTQIPALRRYLRDMAEAATRRQVADAGAQSTGAQQQQQQQQRRDNGVEGEARLSEQGASEPAAAAPQQQAAAGQERARCKACAARGDLHWRLRQRRRGGGDQAGAWRRRRQRQRAGSRAGSAAQGAARGYLPGRLVL